MALPTGNTALAITGVGSGMLISTAGDIVEIIKGQDLSLSLTSTDEKIYGGDSLYPIFSFVKEKGGKVTISDATFYLNQLKVTQNATVNTTTAKKYVREEIVVSAATAATLANVTGVDYTSIVCYNKSTGVGVTNVGVGTPTTAVQFKGTALGAITFGLAVTGTYVFSYYVTDATATASATVATNLLPVNSELRWKLVTQDLSGNSYEINLRAKNVRTSGSFNMDFKRGTASVSKLEFEILQPTDGSTDFVEVSVTDI